MNKAQKKYETNRLKAKKTKKYPEGTCQKCGLSLIRSAAYGGLVCLTCEWESAIISQEIVSDLCKDLPHTFSVDV